MNTASAVDMKIVEETKRIVGASFPKIVQCFLNVSTDYVAEISSGLSEQDLHKVASGAHTLKSSSIQVGAALLSEKAREIELMAKREDVTFQDLQAALTELFEELEGVRTTTENELNQFV